MCEMTRANIRFYESEGLLTPARNQNGYRDYSCEDAEVLKRIRLLRTLHISLEEIKALHSGEQELTEVLERQLKALEAQQADLKRSGEICRVMRNDNVRYESLDAQRYLNEMQTVFTDGGGAGAGGRYLAQGADSLETFLGQTSGSGFV